MTGPDDLAACVRGLRKRYGDVTALGGIDLEVRRGEILALLGPNGAGKTTALEIMAGYRVRDGGTVAVLGTDPAARGRAGRLLRARIGVVAQTGAALPNLSLARIAEHFAGYYPVPMSGRDALALVGLAGQASARPGQLSGGQRRRLDVALGLLGRPELLFLDEPTAGFDPDARRQFWALIRGLAQGGTAILLTTHYLDEAEALADRVAIIVAGQLIETAAPASLGGRQQAGATVSWRDAGGCVRSATTAAPTALIAELARRCDGEIPGLTVSRPTLDDIYLDMIGAV